MIFIIIFAFCSLSKGISAFYTGLCKMRMRTADGVKDYTKGWRKPPTVIRDVYFLFFHLLFSAVRRPHPHFTESFLSRLIQTKCVKI